MNHTVQIPGGEVLITEFESVDFRGYTQYAVEVRWQKPNFSSWGEVFAKVDEFLDYIYCTECYVRHGKTFSQTCSHVRAVRVLRRKQKSC